MGAEVVDNPAVGAAGPTSDIKLPASSREVGPEWARLSAAGEFDDARRLVLAALARWPDEPDVLKIAVSDAVWTGEFERAMVFGHQLVHRAESTPDELLQVEARVLLASTALAQNKPEEAEVILNGIPERHASHPSVQLTRMLILRIQWRLEESYRLINHLYDWARENSKLDAPITIQWGWAQAHAGHYDEALATLNELDAPLAKALYCETLTFKGNWDEALQGLEQLRSQDPFDVSTLQVLGTVLLRRHRYGEVLAVADEIESFYRGDTVALQLKAAALIRTRRVNDARKVLAEGLQRFPSSSALRVNLGWCDLAQRDLDTAVETFQPLASRRPHDPTSRTGLAVIAFQRRDYEQALERFTAIADDSVIDPGVKANLALTLAALDRDDDAVPYCKKALELDPTNIQALTCASGIEFRSGNLGKAEALAVHAVACDPGDSSCRVTLAAIESAVGGYEAAGKLLEEVIREDPRLAQAHVELGSLEYKTGNAAQARVCLRRALEIDRQLPAGYLALADVELQEGRLVEAESILRQGIDQMKPRDPSLHARLGHVLRLLGEQARSPDCYAEASVQLTTALRDKPDDASALFDLGVVQFRQDDFGAAKRSFMGMLKLKANDPYAQVMLTRIGAANKEPRRARWWSIALAVAAVTQSVAVWVAFLVGDLSETTFVGLLSLFVGLLLVAALFPKLTKVQLGGLQAEMTTVVYQDDTVVASGPPALLPMTASGTAAASIWFWA